MITFNEAYQIVIDHALLMGTENVPLDQSLNRILAQDIVCDMDMPPFNKAAMDGYACRQEDLKNELTVIENIAAGYTPTQAIGPNQCSKIMTGAMVPEGADCVIMVEYTEDLSTDTIRYLKDATKSNICIQAEDVKTGDTVLTKGARIQPQHIAILATTGYVNPLVSKQPRVAVISTGSELVPPAQKPSGPQIRNSNGWQLSAQVTAMGAIATNYGIAKDTKEDTDTIIAKVMKENDILILSGGVSMGDFDLVPASLKANGFELLFDSVAIQPGRPSTFGVVKNTRCFALPGNPVSTFIQFEMLVKPFLFAMMGHADQPVLVEAQTTAQIKRRNTTRAAVIPIKFTTPNTIKQIDYHGSAHINAMCNTDGFVVIPIGEESIEKGSRVDVRLL